MLRIGTQVRLFCCLLLAAIILTWTAADGAQRRRPQTQFRPGQKVQFDNFGRICDGEVVSINSFGRVKVRYKDNGQDRTWDYSPDELWLPKKAPASSTRPQAQMRTWTDSSGLYKIEARFVELADGKVTLEKGDGTKKSMPLDKLSEDDQLLVKKLAAGAPPKNPFEGADDSSPPRKDAEDAASMSASETQPLNDEDIVAPDGDWSTVKEIVVDASAKSEFVPDAAVPTDIDHLHTLTLDLTKAAAGRDFQHEKLEGFFFNRERGRLVVVSTNRELRGGRRGPRLEACDLKTGKSLGALVLDTGTVPRDMSPDGASIVCMPTHLSAAFHKQRGIEVWRLEKGGKLIKRWNPHDTREKEEIFNVDHAKFISRDLLLTINTNRGKATAWDVNSARALYTLSVDGLSRPALSVNRKQMAVSCEGVIAVLDAVTGGTLLILNDTAARSHVAAYPRRRHAQAAVRFAFRPDGLQLAALIGDDLQIWDLQKQVLLRETWLSPLSGQNAPELLEWVDNDHLLVNGADLIDIPKRIVLWHYEVPGQEKSLECVVNGNLGFGYGQTEGARGHATLRASVFFLPLPHPQALQVAASATEEQRVALKAGSQVALELQVPSANPQESEALTASYTEQLKQRGISVVPGAPLIFRTSIDNAKTDSVTYRAMGFGSSEAVNVTRQICHLVLVENGKVLWEKSALTGGASMMMSHKQDESIQTIVDRQNQESITGFFRGISLPGCIARQGEHGAFGFSKLTPMGPIPYEPAK
jgi:hypothetical protein